MFNAAAGVSAVSGSGVSGWGSSVAVTLDERLHCCLLGDGLVLDKVSLPDGRLAASSQVSAPDCSVARRGGGRLLEVVSAFFVEPECVLFFAFFMSARVPSGAGRVK